MTAHPSPSEHGSAAAKALRLRETWRNWLRWLAVASLAFAVAAIGAAVWWSASIADDASAVLIWAWAAFTAVHYLVAAVLIMVNATSRTPGWLAIVYVLGTVAVGIAEFGFLVAAMVATDSSRVVLLVWLVGSTVAVVVSGIGLLWPGVLALQERQGRRDVR
ncbi:hypothetical protein [Demequina sp.]|uniref:hypothetical protein n=1 Tax=Demequina sp. TaxID=2050685 RepID=UPI003A892BDE